MAKAKAIEAETKLMAEEREIMLVDTTNMTEGQKAWGGEASCHHPTTQRMTKHYLHKLLVSIINIMHSLFLLVSDFWLSWLVHKYFMVSEPRGLEFETLLTQF
jgi:hypothetical protein